MQTHTFTQLEGRVTHFDGNGRSLGYPTANISVETALQEGVYFGFCNLEAYKNQPSLIFIGTPTTLNKTKHRVEAHLLDAVDKDYYGLNLQITLGHFHRPNQHFSSIEELVKTIKADEIAGRKWFKQQNLPDEDH